MKYAAKIVDNVVADVIVVSDSQGIAWAENTYGGVWVETWPNGGARKNYAGIGYTFDATRNAFIPPKPYPSWVLVESTCQWDAPIPMPAGGPWEWDEDIEEWVAV
jgi:hypothetical protein